MKKVFFVLFLCFPVVAFGVPSVRMLGNQSATVAASGAGTKVTPAKASVSNETNAARVGSLRVNNKATASAPSATNGKLTRFPSITPMHSYGIAKTPKTKEPAATSGTPSTNVDVDVIVNAVMQNVENNLYNTEGFKEGVREVEDPRFDAIRVRTAAQGSPASYWDNKNLDLPSGYVYMWVEEN